MSDFFTALIAFLLIHIICDFYLQPKRWVKAKQKRTYRAAPLYVHSLLHGVALLIPACALGFDWHAITGLVVIVAVSHWLIDLWKVTRRQSEKFAYFIIDQALHIVVLTALAFSMTNSITMAGMLHNGHLFSGVMILFAYLLILKPSSVVIGCILRKYPLSPADADSHANGLVAGGELIGYLERILILTFTLVGSYSAVGFVLAAKSIFRFGELNQSADRNMTEYVLIGSLVSVVISTLIGTLVSLGLNISIQ